MANYYVLHKNTNGDIINVIPQEHIISIELARKVNDFGFLYLDIQPTYESVEFAPDSILEVYRTASGPEHYYLEGNTQWLVRLSRSKDDESNHRVFHVIAYDAVQLLDRRIIAYPSQSLQANKTDKADDMIKHILHENLGGLATDTARDITQYLSIDDFLGLAPEITKTFPWRKMLATLQEIATASLEAGTYLAFDVTKGSEKLFQFNTFVGQRGTDRGITSTSPLRFNKYFGNLSYASLAYDNSEEITYVYVGGRGEEEEREVVEVSDPVRIQTSVFNRIEDFVDGRSEAEGDTDALEEDGRSRLQEMSPKKIFNGHILQTAACMYGVHYDFGDIVVGEYENNSIDVHLDSYSIKYEGGREEISIMARNYEDET